MHHDQITRVFPLRRTVLKAIGGAALGAAGIGKLLAQSQVTGSPSLTEGPYFVDEDLNRSDIRVDPSDNTIQAGYPLSLSINVSQLKDGVQGPLNGAYVDLWHCNALGVYSDIQQQNSSGKKFLRGYQTTDRHGSVYFMTIYPGWYTGRAVHIHVKVRVFDGGSQTYEFTSQFFMDDSFSDQIYTLAPYNTRNGSRDTRNTSDGIYNGGSSTGTLITSNSGSYLMLTMRNRQSWAEADAKLVCDLSLGSSPDLTGPEGGGPGGGGPGALPPGGGIPPGVPGGPTGTPPTPPAGGQGA